MPCVLVDQEGSVALGFLCILPDEIGEPGAEDDAESDDQYACKYNFINKHVRAPHHVLVDRRLPEVAGRLLTQVKFARPVPCGRMLHLIQINGENLLPRGFARRCKERRRNNW
jgi:hypothetical protein